MSSALYGYDPFLYDTLSVSLWDRCLLKCTVRTRSFTASLTWVFETDVSWIVCLSLYLFPALYRYYVIYLLHCIDYYFIYLLHRRVIILCLMYCIVIIVCLMYCTVIILCLMYCIVIILDILCTVQLLFEISHVLYSYYFRYLMYCAVIIWDILCTVQLLFYVSCTVKLLF